ncbi:MAG: polynucleotide 5-hydroxyl-kinase [Actinomycetota bacterium]|nr:polynucleotide 5-hydroxyl-kinase [Actinomycetota bacterium]MEA2581676.1 polynucleotide 5-hydroxyl-kinase [Actinomycetota bacterium]
MNEHDRLVDRAARDATTVLFLGGLDAGKSTLARATAAYALHVGRSVAYLDADVSQKTVGPPATVGMKHIRSVDDLTFDRLAEADHLGFVGSTSPADHLLPLVGALARLRDLALSQGADLVVVDTGGVVGGISGQLVKYYKVDALEPDLIVALQRGEELDPVLGVIERFFGIDAVTLPIHPRVEPSSVEDRMAQRERQMSRYFAGDLHRFRVKPTVFMPTLPPLFDLKELDRLMVGLSDGGGGFTGVGYLEHVAADGGLRLISPVAEAPKALRLGSVRLEANYRAKRVDLRNLFGTE